MYVVFGKDIGWLRDVNLHLSDTSFIGEQGGELADSAISDAGNVNGDAYNDFIISPKTPLQFRKTPLFCNVG